MTRTSKYAAKISGDVARERTLRQKTAQDAAFGSAVAGQVQIEQAVGNILGAHGVSSIFYNYYIDFGKKLDKLRRTHRAGTLQQEVCAQRQKWISRSLSSAILDELINVFIPGFSCIPMACDYPDEADVKVGVTYSFGTKTGTYTCPGCDYPDAGGVLDGVVYAFGTMVGEYVCPAADYPGVGDVLNGVVYAFGTMTGTYVCPAVDYPVVGDVVKGVVYAGGTMTGTFDEGLPWTGQTVSYAANDDGAYQKGHTTDRPEPGARFTDNGDGTITDHATGLMWEKAVSAGTYSWTNAMPYAEAQTTAGHTDWRLPNINEMLSIADYSRFNPSVNSTFFPGAASTTFWSSTTAKSNTAWAWRITYNAPSLGISDKTGANNVRCVRLGGP